MGSQVPSDQKAFESKYGEEWGCVRHFSVHINASVVATTKEGSVLPILSYEGLGNLGQIQRGELVPRNGFTEIATQYPSPIKTPKMTAIN